MIFVSYRNSGDSKLIILLYNYYVSRMSFPTILNLSTSTANNFSKHTRNFYSNPQSYLQYSIDPYSILTYLCFMDLFL